MSFLSRDAILGADDLPHEDVFVPEWNGTVRVRGLTAGERDAFEASVLKENRELSMEDFRAKLVAMSLVDEAGNRMFTMADVKALTTKSASALQRLFMVAQQLSGFTETAVEELRKNS